MKHEICPEGVGNTTTPDQPTGDNGQPSDPGSQPPAGILLTGSPKGKTKGDKKPKAERSASNGHTPDERREELIGILDAHHKREGRILDNLKPMTFEAIAEQLER